MHQPELDPQGPSLYADYRMHLESLFAMGYVQAWALAELPDDFLWTATVQLSDEKSHTIIRPEPHLALKEVLEISVLHAEIEVARKQDILRRRSLGNF